MECVPTIVYKNIMEAQQNSPLSTAAKGESRVFPATGFPTISPNTW
jgi:hypothetical protein